MSHFAFCFRISAQISTNLIFRDFTSLYIIVSLFRLLFLNLWHYNVDGRKISKILIVAYLSWNSESWYKMWHGNARVWLLDSIWLRNRENKTAENLSIFTDLHEILEMAKWVIWAFLCRRVMKPARHVESSTTVYLAHIWPVARIWCLVAPAEQFLAIPCSLKSASQARATLNGSVQKCDSSCIFRLLRCVEKIDPDILMSYNFFRLVKKPEEPNEMLFTSHQIFLTRLLCTLKIAK